jgi:hypothetical protein
MNLIRIHSNKTITISNYISAWKTLKSMTKEEREKTQVKNSLCTWWPVSAEVCYQQYIAGVHDRINLKANKK